MNRRVFFKKLFIGVPALTALPVIVNSSAEDNGFTEVRALAYWTNKLDSCIANNVAWSLYAQLVYANGVERGVPVLFRYVPQNQPSKDDPLGQRGYFGVITKKHWPEDDPTTIVDDDFRLLESKFMELWRA